MPATKRIDRKMKEKFVKNMIATGNNRTEAYMRTMPTTHARTHAAAAGCALFKDPEVQEIFHAKGINLEYLATKNKELMESSNEPVKASIVRQWNRAIIPTQTQTTEVKKLNVNLFGDITDAQAECIRQGRKFIEEDGGASQG